MARVFSLFAAAFVVFMPLPVQAFDCAKATTKTEKLICSDSALKQADDRLGDAWTRMRETLADDEYKAMLASQRAWLRSREERCGYGSSSERVSCLLEVTRERALLISASPGSGPGGGGSMVPFALQQKGSKTVYEINLAGVRFTEPERAGEVAFNEAIDALIADAPLKTKVDFESPGGLTYNQSIVLTYASPFLVSALVSTDRYDGGAHPNYFFSSINVSPEIGVLTTDMLFSDGARVDLEQACAQNLFRKGNSTALGAAERKEILSPEYEKVIEGAVGSMSSWTFDADGALLHFSPYDLSSYAAGAFECRLSLPILRGLTESRELLPQ